MTNSLGRFKVIKGNPPVLPNKCAVCGTTEAGETYLDFGLDLDFYGTVYLGGACFREAANTLGYYSPEQYDLAMAKVEATRQENNRLLEILEAYKNVVGSIDHINSSSVAIPEPTSVELPEQQEPKLSDKEPKPDNSKPQEKGRGFIKPVNEQRSTNVQRDDSLDSLLDDI